MNHENTDFVRGVLKKLAKLNYIKPGEVPNINLYMDQVTTFMDEHMSDIKRHADDKILTKTMINNYTKNNLLPAPEKKKYSKDHIYILAFIYYFKNLLSISDIQKILDPMTENFFHNEDGPTLDYIYEEIYNIEKEQLSSLAKDVFIKSKIANTSFDTVEDPDDKEYLQLFALVSLLSFDVYMKKNIIQNLIDDFTEKHAEPEDEKAKGKKDKDNKNKDSKNKDNTKK